LAADFHVVETDALRFIDLRDHFLPSSQAMKHNLVQIASLH
jgi:hypothetical protein